MDTATTYDIPTTATVTQEQVDYLLCAAFEGGITYWCDSASTPEDYPEGATWLHQTLTRGATIFLHDMEDDDVLLLTLDKFLVGIAKAAAHMRQDVVTFLEEHDAVSADLAVQFALFGEIIYG